MSLGTVVTYGKNTVDENILWILVVFLKVELYTRVGLENQKLTNDSAWAKLTVFGYIFPQHLFPTPKQGFQAPGLAFEKKWPVLKVKWSKNIKRRKMVKHHFLSFFGFLRSLFWGSLYTNRRLFQTAEGLVFDINLQSRPFFQNIVKLKTFRASPTF